MKKDFMRGCVGNLMETGPLPAEDLLIWSKYPLLSPTPRRSNPGKVLQPCRSMFYADVTPDKRKLPTASSACVYCRA